MIIPKKLPKDPNQRAHQIARMLTEGASPDEVVTERSERMAQIGKKGGRKGGASRTKALSAERRSDIAKKAAEARWKPKTSR
jgi:general stress protein YciG